MSHVFSHLRFGTRREAQSRRQASCADLFVCYPYERLCGCPHRLCVVLQSSQKNFSLLYRCPLALHERIGLAGWLVDYLLSALCSCSSPLFLPQTAFVLRSWCFPRRLHVRLLQLSSRTTMSDSCSSCLTASWASGTASRPHTSPSSRSVRSEIDLAPSGAQVNPLQCSLIDSDSVATLQGVTFFFLQRKCSLQPVCLRFDVSNVDAPRFKKMVILIRHVFT